MKGIILSCALSPSETYLYVRVIIKGEISSKLKYINRDCRDAYEKAYENLRSDNNNLQLAKILWLWGSALARLRDPMGHQKMEQALEIAKGRQNH